MTSRLDGFINRLGFSYNAIGIYFLFRILIKDFNDFIILLKTIVVCSIFVAVSMLIEQETGRNLFSIFRGVKEFSEIRYEKLRAQGPFAHPILAGTFGATVWPLLAGFLLRNKNRILAILGISCVTIIVLISHSSGPAIAYVCGIVGFIMWNIRMHMKFVRRGILLIVILLAIVMKAPIWFLIARLNNIIGGTGWHRSMVIDTAINHFSDWWLFGSESYSQWGFLMRDVTNQYVFEGYNGGLLKMLLFITIIVLCFRAVGMTLKQLEDISSTNRICVWSLGVALMTHVVSFFSVSYFDQMIVFWYLLLSMISIMSNLPPNEYFQTVNSITKEC
jgi:hypothetical protein